MTFANQVAIVTGASSGIGRGVAFALAAQGCKLGLIARREEQLREVAREIEQAGGTAAYCAADVTDRHQVLSAIARLREQLGPIDLLVANAGLGTPDRFDPLSVDDFEAMVRVNYLGVVYAIEAVLPEMLARGRGHLAAVSSQGAYKGMPGSAGYCASKAAVSTFMESLRIELRNRGIAVTTICPGFVRTEMTAKNAFYMPGLLDADEAGRQIVRALERQKKVYNFPWQTTLLMKAVRWLPDWLLARFPRKSDV
ncbi:MAG: SDR family NAD(P)-dependent oxidoreductase [Planctomycetaceae bacterium]